MRGYFTIATILACTLSHAGMQEHNIVKLNTFTYEQSLQQAASPIYTKNQTSGMLSEATRYEKLAKTTDWPVLPSGPLLSFGDSHPHIPILRKQLQLLGDYPVESNCDSSDLFDVDLHDALIHFQQRHGRKVDGILGRNSRRLLNISPQQRAATLKLNVYRISQFESPQPPYIRVNIPEYNLRFVQGEQPTLTMKTIVGKRKRKTPIFTTEINRVVVNPSWHVPKSIAYKDILPAWQDDPDYLKKLNLKVVSGWGKQQQQIPDAEVNPDSLYQGDNYQRFWEPPSDKNTLGKVKFLTTGPYAIYLHDTSAKRLFLEKKRSFSSGCIRLEQPRKLADALLAYSNRLTKEDVSPIFNRSETETIQLAKPVRLFTTYWTAWQDSNGTLHFRDDVYRRDKQDLITLNTAIQKTILNREQMIAEIDRPVETDQ